MQLFPYRKTDHGYFPTVPIELTHLSKTIATDALVDSGADTSIFRGEYADLLGIPLERGEKVLMKGISGELTVYFHNIHVQFMGNPYVWRIGFSRGLKFAFNLLGRKGFFENNEITFNEKQKRLTITQM